MNPMLLLTNQLTFRYIIIMFVHKIYIWNKGYNPFMKDSKHKNGCLKFWQLDWLDLD